MTKPDSTDYAIAATRKMPELDALVRALRAKIARRRKWRWLKIKR